MDVSLVRTQTQQVEGYGTTVLDYLQLTAEGLEEMGLTEERKEVEHLFLQSLEIQREMAKRLKVLRENSTEFVERFGPNSDFTSEVSELKAMPQFVRYKEALNIARQTRIERGHGDYKEEDGGEADDQQAEEGDDDGVQVRATKRSLKCPLTLRTLEDPVTK